MHRCLYFPFCFALRGVVRTAVGLSVILAGLAQASEITPEVRSADVKLVVGDRIQVRVFQEADLGGEFKVAPNGSIDFPLVGRLDIADQTLSEASDKIKAALKRFLKQPYVNVSLIEQAPRRITILGQVHRPGVYLLPPTGQLSLLGAIGEAGGTTPLGNLRNVLVKRKRARTAATEIININAAPQQNTPEFWVADGDLIIVGERMF